MNPYEGESPRRRRAFVWIAFAVAVTGVWVKKDEILKNARGAKENFAAEVEKVQNRSAPPPESDSGVAPPRRAVLESDPAAAPHSAQAPFPAPVPVEPSRPMIARRPPAPEEPDAVYRRLYGVVYDLDSASPVAGATMKFKAKLGTEWTVKTGADGSYGLDVDRMIMDAGLVVSITAPGYRDGQLEDLEPPYRERPRERRLEAIAELGPTDLDPVPLRARASERVSNFDFALVSEKPAK